MLGVVALPLGVFHTLVGAGLVGAVSDVAVHAARLLEVLAGELCGAGGMADFQGVSWETPEF
jgi:hypothetical protein